MRILVQYAQRLRIYCRFQAAQLLYSLLAATLLEASSGTFNVFFLKSLRYLSVLLKVSTILLCCVEVSWRIFFGDFSWESGGTLPPNSYKPFQVLWNYPVKDNTIGSTVSEILRYTQTDRQADIQLHQYKDWCFFYFL